MATLIPHTYRRRSGIYYARLFWPKALHPALADAGLSPEIRCSLRTHSPFEARRRMSALLSFFHNTVDEMHNTVFLYSSEHFKLARRRICESLTQQGDVEMPMALIRPAARTLHAPPHQIQQVKCDLTPGSSTRWNAVTPFSSSAATFSPYLPSTTPSPLGKAIFESTHEGYRIHSDATDPLMAAKEIAALHAAIGTGGGTGGGGHSGSINQGVLLSDARDEYFKLMCKGRWKKGATAKQAKTRLGIIVELLGADRDTTSLTLKDIEQFEAELVARIDVNSARRGRSRENRTLAVSTVKALISLTRAFLRYCYKRNYLTDNLAEYLGDLTKDVTPRKKKLNPYKPFTSADLEKIFGQYLYANGDLKSCRKMLDSFFWAPLIALHTGMRLNEICQLRVCDIQQEDGIWFISTDDPTESQSTKNESSKRRIPLHRELVRIGLLKFRAARQSEDGVDGMLFRGLKWDAKNQWIKQTSRWFVGESACKGYLDIIGLDERAHKTFHSFRHTFIRRMRQLGVSSTEIAAIVGHETGLTTEQYGGEYDLQRLKTIIDQLNYPIDLGHIRHEHFKLYQLADGQPHKRAHLLDARLRTQAKPGRRNNKNNNPIIPITNDAQGGA